MKKIKVLTVLLGLTINSVAQTNACLDFDGVDDYLLVGDENNLGTNDFTLEAWVNCESVSGIGQYVISKGLTTVGTPMNSGYGIRINDQNSNDVEFIIGHNDATSKVLSAISLSVNNWHHIAGVKSGLQVYLYVDGNLVAQDSTLTLFDVNTNIPLSIGAHHKGTQSSVAEFMNGKIDEVRIWNTARTAEQINEFKDCAITSSKENLLAVYNFNENGGITALDSSGYSNDASFEGNPIWVNSSVAPICSKLGEEEYVGINSNIELYPNPFYTEIKIENGPGNGNYSVYNMYGKTVKSGIFTNSTISLSELIQGSFILEIVNNDKVWRKRIVKI